MVSLTTNISSQGNLQIPHFSRHGPIVRRYVQGYSPKKEMVSKNIMQEPILWGSWYLKGWQLDAFSP